MCMHYKNVQQLSSTARALERVNDDVVICGRGTQTCWFFRFIVAVFPHFCIFASARVHSQKFRYIAGCDAVSG